MQITLSPASSQSRCGCGLGVPSEGQAPTNGPLGALRERRLDQQPRRTCTTPSVSLPFPRFPYLGTWCP